MTRARLEAEERAWVESAIRTLTTEPERPSTHDYAFKAEQRERAAAFKARWSR